MQKPQRRAKKKKMSTDKDWNYMVSKKRQILVYYGIGRNTRYSANRQMNSCHPSLLQLQTNVDITNFRVLDFTVLFERYYTPCPHSKVFVYTNYKRENGYSYAIESFDCDMSSFPIPCGLCSIQKTVDR